jgi:serine/threonine protein kinase
MTADPRSTAEILDSFESAWQSAPPPPQLAAYWPAMSPDADRALLLELLKLDIHYRLRKGNDTAPLVRVYFERDRLSLDADAQLELIEAEHQARWEAGERVPRQEYCDYFPALADQLRQRLPDDRWSDDPPGYDRRDYPRLGRPKKGGMGAVYRTEDPGLRRDLAIKVIHPRHQGKPEYEERFRREAYVLGQLPHPSIVPIHSFGRLPDGRLHFTMKLVRGDTLAERLNDREDAREDVADYLRIFMRICEAMAFAHARKILHRDLKPANVMVGNHGEVQVMDWGLATDPDGESDLAPSNDDRTRPSAPTLTRLGQAMGTPLYMAPEQARGVALDSRADVFALGAILCEILTGKPPFDEAEALEQSRSGQLDQAWKRLDECRQDAELVQLARDCLHPLPADPRPIDAGAVVERLVRHRQNEAERTQKARDELVAAEAREGAERLEKEAAQRASRWLKAASVLLISLALLAVAFVFVYRHQSSANADLAKDERDARTKADEQKVKAEHLAEVARNTFSQSLERLRRKPVTWMSHEERVPTAILKDALKFFLAYREELEEDPNRRFELGQVNRWMGDVYQQLRQYEDAKQAYRSAESILAGLVSTPGADAIWQEEFAYLNNNLGILYQTQKQAAAAKTAFDKCVALFRALVVRHPEIGNYQQELASSLVNLADLLSKNEEGQEEADTFYKEASECLQKLKAAAPTRLRYRRLLAETYESWATLFPIEDEENRRDKYLVLSLTLFDELAKDDPDDTDYSDAQIRVRQSHGSLHLDRGELRDAEVVYNKALELSRDEAKASGTPAKNDEDIREILESIQSVAFEHEDQSAIAQEKKEWRKAETAQKEAIRLFEELSREEGSDQLNKLLSNLVYAHLTLGDLNLAEGERSRAEKSYRTGLKAIRGAEDARATQGSLERSTRNRLRYLALSHQTEGDEKGGQGQFAPARQSFRSCIAAMERLAIDFPTSSEVRRDLAIARNRLGQSLALEVRRLPTTAEAKKQITVLLEEAEKVFGQAYADLRVANKGAPKSAKSEREFAQLAQIRGSCFRRLVNNPSARDVLLAALAHFQAYLKSVPDDSTAADEIAQVASMLSDVLFELGEHQTLATTAREWHKSLPEDGRIAFLSATALARCTSIVTKGTTPQQKRLADSYAVEAVAILRTWTRVEFDKVKTPLDPKLVRAYLPFAPLRNHAEFAKFLAERERLYQVPTPWGSPVLASTLLGFPPGRAFDAVVLLGAAATVEAATKKGDGSRE